MSAFKIGQTVFITTLNKTGEVVDFKGKDKSIAVVQLGLIKAECKLADLQVIEKTAKPVRRARREETARQSIKHSSKNSRTVPSTLDLHGRTVAEAIPLVETFMSDAVLAQHGIVDLVHGIGEGRLKQAIHAHLPSIGVVKRYEVLPFNSGTTRVYLG